MQTKKTRSLKSQILLPLSIAIVLLLGVLSFHLFWDDYGHLDDVAKRFESAKQLHRGRIESEVELMSAVIEVMMLNPDIQAAWQAQDRKRLFELSKPILNEMRFKHNVSHFYFHDAQRVNFLRVYHPEKFGDKIDRYTLLDAESSGQASYGLEVGELEGLTLRVVYPWKQQDKILGYIEMGIDFEQIAKELKEILPIEMFAVIKKDNTDTLNLARFEGYDRFDEYVVVSQTLETVPDELEDFISKEHEEFTFFRDTLLIDGKHYMTSFSKFGYLQSQYSGGFLILQDVTQQYKYMQYSFFSIGSVFLLVSISIVWFFYVVLGRAEQQLSAAQEKELFAQEQMQAEKMASLEVLVSGVAHEINNPTNFIMFNAPMLARMCNDTMPILEKYYKECGEFQVAGMPYTKFRQEVGKIHSGIAEGADRIKRIVMELKDFAPRTLACQHEDVDLNNVVRSAVQFMEQQISESTSQFHVDYTEPLPVISGDFHKLEQVVVNLISNACEALSGASQAIKVSTNYNELERKIIVEVRDQGCGISSQNIGKIKDPFFTTKHDQGGTGLGLAVSYGIVKEHGGSLDYTSQEMGGTVARLGLTVKGV